MKSRSDPATWDGGGDTMAGPGITGDNPATMQTFPVSSEHLADQRSRAIALGLQTSGAIQGQDGGAETAVAAATASHLYGKGRIIDASEGTSFDPLRDRSYDLTTAKVVPTMKGLPPVKPLAASN